MKEAMTKSSHAKVYGIVRPGSGSVDTDCATSTLLLFKSLRSMIQTLICAHKQARLYRMV